MSTPAYQVYTPEPTGPYSVTFVRFGRTFATLEAAERTAKRFSGQIQPYGSNNILIDYSVDLEAPTPRPAPRQSRQQALAAYLGVRP